MQRTRTKHILPSECMRNKREHGEIRFVTVEEIYCEHFLYVVERYEDVYIFFRDQNKNGLIIVCCHLNDRFNQL